MVETVNRAFGRSVTADKDCSGLVNGTYRESKCELAGNSRHSGGCGDKVKSDASDATAIGVLSFPTKMGLSSGVWKHSLRPAAISG